MARQGETETINFCLTLVGCDDNMRERTGPAIIRPERRRGINIDGKDGPVKGLTIVRGRMIMSMTPFLYFNESSSCGHVRSASPGCPYPDGYDSTLEYKHCDQVLNMHPRNREKLETMRILKGSSAQHSIASTGPV